MFGGLNSIRSLSSGNLSDDRLLRVSRKLRGMTRRRDKSIRKDILEYPGCSRSSNTSLQAIWKIERPLEARGRIFSF